MEKIPSFKINLSGFTAHRLYPEDIGPLQTFFEKCADYFLLTEGEDVSHSASQEIFESTPPGKLLADKFVFGLINFQGEIAGALEVTRNYPEENIWWMGLLLLAPDIRKQGIGRKFLESFFKYVEANEGLAIMGGIVEDNELARKFWFQAGFELVRKTEPRQFGKKQQAIFVIRRVLGEKLSNMGSHRNRILKANWT